MVKDKMPELYPCANCGHQMRVQGLGGYAVDSIGPDVPPERVHRVTDPHAGAGFVLHCTCSHYTDVRPR